MTNSGNRFLKKSNNLNVFSLKSFFFSYLHDPNHYQICVEREDPKTVYVALKSKIMTAYAKEWGLEDATRLLQRFIESLDEDLMVVKDYVDKVKRKLEAKIATTTSSRGLDKPLLDMSIG